ncbi:hypothetical protein [Microbacterium azadirachtae]|uniref:hypothetical protein n=1 Tax=Microbacterium azadirachtae TaxID=582680 RepID=UPI001113DB53|nr:hypothetical protein [Microbacterium azadirachtae]
MGERLRWIAVALVLVAGIGYVSFLNGHRSSTELPPGHVARPSMLAVYIDGPASVTRAYSRLTYDPDRGYELDVQAFGVTASEGTTSITIASSGSTDDWMCFPVTGFAATWGQGVSESTNNLAFEQAFRVSNGPPASAAEARRIPLASDDWEHYATVRASSLPTLPKPEFAQPGPPIAISPQLLMGIRCQDVPVRAALPTAEEIAKYPNHLSRLRVPANRTDRFHQVSMPSVYVSGSGIRTTPSVDIVVPQFWALVAGHAGGLDTDSSGYHLATDPGTKGTPGSWDLTFEDQLVVRSEEQDRALYQTTISIVIGIAVSVMMAVPLDGWTRRRRNMTR